MVDRKLTLRAVVFVAILALMAVVAVSAYSQPSALVQGATWDEGRWSGIILPDSAAVCRVRPDGSIGCVSVPPGSVILIPTPQ